MPSLNRRSFLLASLLVAIFAAPRILSADDGSWSDQRGFTPAEGALYAPEGDASIILEKEYLELEEVESGRTRAVFLFKNSSAQPRTVECAFPILVRYEARAFSLYDKVAWDFGDLRASRYSPGDSAERDRGWLNDLLSALGVLTDPWEPEELYPDDAEGYVGLYFPDSGYPRGRRDLPADRIRRLFEFRILADGKETAVPTLVADFGAAPGELTLHFRHRLAFAPGQSLKVEVRYALPTWAEDSGDPGSLWAPGVQRRYRWDYILETGASWKGPLGKLLLALPPGFEGTLPESWSYLGTRAGKLFYAFESRDPRASDDLALEWIRPELDYVGYWRDRARTLAAEDLGGTVVALARRASSRLPDKAAVFLRQGIWNEAPFDEARLFDGLPETAWAVTGPSGGIGEWVEFELMEEAARLEVSNGYLRSPVDFPDRRTWSYFGRNNRVKGLELLDATGARRLLDLPLADRREVQLFDLGLKPGVYRARIAEIYKGSQWNDTCLGELAFVPGRRRGFAGWEDDPFFAPWLAPR